MHRYANLLLLMLVLTINPACGGGGAGSVLVAPPDGDPPPTDVVPEIAVQQIFEQLSFSAPVALKQAPGDDTRWFVVEKRGVVRVFDNEPNASSTAVFLNLTNVVDSVGEGGLLGLAFHPDFPTTPEVFVSYTRTGTGTPFESHISRIYSMDNGQTLDAGSEEILLTVLQEERNHNGGDLQFGPDGNLYIAFGDSGGGGDPREYAQNTGTLHGSILRLNVDGNTPYEIPPGNPFSANAFCTQGFGSAPCPEIFAWGLRNPWRFSFDGVTGKLWAGDVGQNAWEEIDVIEAGGNYGWNDREGAHCFDPPTGCATNFTDPITEYDHTMGDRSVTGGYVYRGTAVPDLVGWYVFGDFVSGRVFAIPEDSQPGVIPDVLLDTDLAIASFATDTDDELYAVALRAGTIHKIQAVP